MSLISNLSLHDDKLFHQAKQRAEEIGGRVDLAVKETRRLNTAIQEVMIGNHKTSVLSMSQIQTSAVARHYFFILWALHVLKDTIARRTQEVDEYTLDIALADGVTKLSSGLSEDGLSPILSYGNNPEIDGLLFVTHMTYVANGRRIYEVSPGLGQRLRLTEVRGIKGKDLHLPYKAIYISVPRSAELIVPRPKDQGIGKAQSPLDGLLLREVATSDPVVRRLRIVAVNQEFPEDLMFESWIWMEMPLIDEEPLTTTLENFRAKTPVVNDILYSQQWKDVFQLVMNVILYATMPDLDEETFIPNEEARRLWKKIRTNKNPKQILKAKKELAKSPHVTVRQLGNKIRVDRTMSVEAFIKSNDGRALNIRVLVAGHHKWQVYGKGRSERKRIFIEPYWRGPEDAPMSESRHQLNIQPGVRHEDHQKI